MATRYRSYDSSASTSTTFSDPSSSAELKTSTTKPRSSSGAIVKSKPQELSQGLNRTKTRPDNNLTAMVKRFVDKKSASKTTGLIIPCDAIAEDLKKTARKGAGLAALQRKLFGKGYSAEKKEVKALIEVKGNTRTLAMVLRSERELVSANKDQEIEIAQLKHLLEEKNREVEKLKDLCLKQREEIKSLKSAVLFPEVMNSQLEELVEKQGLELKQAKQLIPTLQKQVTSLTGQIQCLAKDLAEVKADKYSASAMVGFQKHGGSPRTPTYEHEEALNSLEFSSGDLTSPGSPDDMFLKDLNPCLTPYNEKTWSMDFQGIDYDPRQSEVSWVNAEKFEDLEHVAVKKLSRSSDCCPGPNATNSVSRMARRSDERKGKGRRHMHGKYF